MSEPRREELVGLAAVGLFESTGGENEPLACDLFAAAMVSDIEAAAYRRGMLRAAEIAEAGYHDLSLAEIIAAIRTEAERTPEKVMSREPERATPDGNFTLRGERRQ